MAIELTDIAYALAPIAVAFLAMALLPSPTAMPPRASMPLPLTTLEFKPNAMPDVPFDKLFLPIAMASGFFAPSFNSLLPPVELTLKYFTPAEVVKLLMASNAAYSCEPLTASVLLELTLPAATLMI